MIPSLLLASKSSEHLTWPDAAVIIAIFAAVVVVVLALIRS